jgi:hypothetical protein
VAQNVSDVDHILDNEPHLVALTETGRLETGATPLPRRLR